MVDSTLTEFQTESSLEEVSENNSELPDAPPDELLTGPIPPITNREEIAPEHPTCKVKTGDLFTIHVDTEEMDWYGLLFLDVYPTNELIGICLHNGNYVTRDRENWIDWFEEHSENGELTEPHMQVYEGVAPIPASDTNEP